MSFLLGVFVTLCLLTTIGAAAFGKIGLVALGCGAVGCLSFVAGRLE